MPKILLNENALYEIENDKYGVFYFTNLNLVSEFILGERKRNIIEYYVLKNKKFMGWSVRVVEDCGDIPFKWINCKHDVLVKRMHEE